MVLEAKKFKGVQLTPAFLLLASMLTSNTKANSLNTQYAINDRNESAKSILIYVL